MIHKPEGRMVQWKYRHVLYKISFWGLVLSILAYVISFAVPYWSISRKYGLGLPKQAMGLWHSCFQEILLCASNVHEDSPAWLNAARAMTSMALILFAGALTYGCFVNVSSYGQSTCQSRGKETEFLAIIGAVLGITGCIIYATKFAENYVQQVAVGHLSWGFVTACGASIMAGFCACMMLAVNRPRFERHSTISSLRSGAGLSGVPIAIQFVTQSGTEHIHIPYFGNVTHDQFMYHSNQLQPPSYEAVTSGDENYLQPPADTSQAPPLYDVVAKESGLPPTVVFRLHDERRCDGDSDL